MDKLRRLSLWVRWGMACGVALLGLLITGLVERLLADNALAYSSDARTGFLVIGGAISVALGLLVMVVVTGEPRAAESRGGLRRWRVRSLFWRLFASYFAATFVTALLATYVGRREGPFRVLIGNPVVEWFSRVGANDTNSALLFVVAATVIGTLTGVLVSLNLRRRLRTMADAALSWSRGDFAARTHDTSQDELGGLARELNHMAEQIESLLASRQELAVVGERNRLARELHDTVKQHVFANALLVRAARKLMDDDPQKARTYLADAEELGGQTQQELIALIQALRPAALEDRGLIVVLHEYVTEWSSRADITAELRAQGERSTPLDLEEALFRVAQEALANAARHSGARQVEVALRWEDERVRLTVADDGKGFDVAHAKGRGLGLASMRERMTALGGTLEITSTALGTTVAAEAPLLSAAPSEQMEAARG